EVTEDDAERGRPALDRLHLDNRRGLDPLRPPWGTRLLLVGRCLDRGARHRKIGSIRLIGRCSSRMMSAWDSVPLGIFVGGPFEVDHLNPLGVRSPRSSTSISTGAPPAADRKCCTRLSFPSDAVMPRWVEGNWATVRTRPRMKPNSSRLTDAGDTWT